MNWLKLELLARPFPANEVDWRVGSTTRDGKKAMALPYIDARVVMDRFDDVCGLAGWQNKYSHVGQKTICDIGVRIGDEWIWKADGAGDTQFEADKGAMSDAFKRAAVRWGVGRYLYSMGDQWVELDERKRFTESAKINLKASLKSSPGSNLHGPLTLTDLKERMKSFCEELGELKDPLILDGFLTDNETVLKQLKRDIPSWFFGTGSDAKGAIERIEEKRQEFAQEELLRREAA